MKKFGDFILALGIVAFLVVIADLYFPNSKLITEGIIGVFIICGVLLLMLIGIILIILSEYEVKLHRLLYLNQ